MLKQDMRSRFVNLCWRSRSWNGKRFVSIDKNTSVFFPINFLRFHYLKKKTLLEGIFYTFAKGIYFEEMTEHL